MSDDSSTGSPLAPSAAPLDDDALDDFFQALVVNVTGLSGSVVFPRFQQVPPNLPAAGSNWAAVGVTPDADADEFPYVGHANNAGVGSDTVTVHETLRILASFYGQNAKGNASSLRDGLKVAQNREPLFLASMGLVSTGTITRAPELVKNLWLNRYDITLTVRRAISRTYPVLNVATLNGEIVDTVTTPIGGNIS